MRLSCAIGNHIAASNPIPNQGLEFSHCVRCGHDMVRSSREWREVPKGFRVAWRRSAPRQTEIASTQLLLDLPSAGRSVALVATRRQGSSQIGLAIELVLLGIVWLAASAARRLGEWARTILSPRRSRQALLALPAG